MDLTIAEEKMSVKGGEDVRFERKVSRHGPIINEVASSLDSGEVAPISLWWNYLEATTSTLQALYEINHAEDMESARNAVSKIDFIGLNVLYGDKAGNIAHWATGRIPKRPEHVNPKFILDGASGKDELLGFYEFSDNPKSENPESGYVISANDDPGTFNGNYFHGYFCPPNRANRIRKHLQRKSKWSQEDMKLIQLDNISDDHKRIASSLVHITVENLQAKDDLNDQILSLMKEWEGGYELDQVEPVIFTKWLYHLMHATMVDEIGEEDFATLQGSYIYKGSLPAWVENETSVWWDDVSTTDVIETRTELVLAAFHKSIGELTEQLGEDRKTWSWQRVHTITHDHVLGAQKPLDRYFNVGPFPISGGNDVPNKMMYVPNADGVYEVSSSPALRIIIDFADVEASENINPTGQSGNVMSKHFSDQAEMFNNGIYRGQLMNEAYIKAHSTQLNLKPK